MNEAIQAVCYPTAAGTACSFNRELMQEMGQLLGQSCQAENVGVLLGPGSEYQTQSPVRSKLRVFL